MQDEEVLVTPTRLFHEVGNFHGFCDDPERYLSRLLADDAISFRPRREVEEDPSFKQLIPYVLICCDSPRGDLFFRYTRGSGQGEGRLHRKQSVGIGGHISLEDAGASERPYEAGLKRELEEEVVLEPGYHAPCVGLINDDRTPVGQVHLGVVHLIRLPGPDARPRESELVECGFVTLEELRADWDRLESWSQIALDALFFQVARQ